MNKKIITTALLLFGIAPMLVGCGSNPTPTPTPTPIYPTGIALDKEDYTLIYDEGATTQQSFVLTATVSPLDYNKGTITWSGGKIEEETYVTLAPSADKKTCTVTAAKYCPNGVPVNVSIMGEDGEHSATCNVVVNKPKVHATSIKFTNTAARNATVRNAIFLDYTTVPAVVDDEIKIISDEAIAAGIAISTKGYIQVTPKSAGTTTFKLEVYDGQTKMCETSETITVTVAEPFEVDAQPGQTVKTQCTNLVPDVNVYNTFKFTLKNDLFISAIKQAKIFVTPTDATKPDTDKVRCYIGLVAKDKPYDYIFNSTSTSPSYAEYTGSGETLKAGTVYYIIVRNLIELPSTKSFDIHIQLPAAE